METRVIHANAVHLDADVLVVKYAQYRYGLDLEVAGRLRRGGVLEQKMSPAPGKCELLAGVEGIRARRVLFTGVEPLWDFSYQQIREFGRTALEYLGSIGDSTRSIVATVHGVGYGLDEVAALESLVAGFLDAVESGQAPHTLETILIAEIDEGRAARLQRVIEEILPESKAALPGDPAAAWPNHEGAQRVARLADAALEKPRIFVAMPFARQMEDVYNFGICGPVRDSGFVCERADLASFLGDVMDWVKNRIRSARLVIADLSGNNANVYLEVGYAWGCGVPTLLLAENANAVSFDLRGQRCLQYETITELSQKLRSELAELQRDGGLGGPSVGSTM